MLSHDASSTSRTTTSVTCTRCHAQTTVPFTPTPGRPVYCRDCFSKRGPAAGPSAARGGLSAPMRHVRAPPRRKMLSQRRKGHFVHDALAELEKTGAMDEGQRRAFVEMVFTRGARQTADAARAFVLQKAEEDVLTDAEAESLTRLIDRYSASQ